MKPGGERRKGRAFENEVKDWLNETFGEGSAERVPLSGAAPGHPDDVVWTLAGLEYRCECKIRKRLAIDGWLGSCPFLFTRQDRGRLLITMEAARFAEFVKVWK